VEAAAALTLRTLYLIKKRDPFFWTVYYTPPWAEIQAFCARNTCSKKRILFSEQARCAFYRGIPRMTADSGNKVSEAGTTRTAGCAVFNQKEG
jgi:hypothetical protein